jgi:hypothetical protein
MKRLMMTTALVLAALAAGALPAQGQSRADSAAVVLHAARHFQAAGDPATARALLEYLQARFAGTAPATEAEGLLLALRRARPDERPGRTELMVWGATYGAWLGIAVPLMLEADSPEAFGLGFLVGAPAGLFIGRGYANATMLSEGQARAITFGGSWGTWQGFGWAEVLRIGDRQYDCHAWGGPWDEPLPGPPGRCSEAHMPTRVAVGVLGGLAGIGTGAMLARRPITAGTAAAVSSSALWGSWFGFSAGYVAGLEDRELLTGTLLVGNAALVAAGLLAPGLELTESRVRLISVSGLVGGLAGVGLALIFQPEERGAVAIPMITSAIGLATGAHVTRHWDDRPERRGQSAPLPGGALVNRTGGAWSLELPAPALRMDAAGGRIRPGAYLPLLEARF